MLKKRILILLLTLTLITYSTGAENKITGNVPFPTPPSPSTGGCSDFNNDGIVNSADLILFQQSFLRTSQDPNYLPLADYDDDRDIDYIDLKCFNEDYGHQLTCPTNYKVCGCVNGCADLNSDGVVTNVDFAILAQSANACIGNPLYIAQADFNNDGCISTTQDSFDFLCFQEKFGDILQCGLAQRIGGCSDFNGDGMVSSGDSQIIQSLIGKSSSDPEFNYLADFDDNNIINRIDFACFRLDFTNLPISCPENARICSLQTLSQHAGGCSDFDYDDIVTSLDSDHIKSLLDTTSSDPNFDPRADYNDDNIIDSRDQNCFRSDLNTGKVCPRDALVCGLTQNQSIPDYRISISSPQITIPADGFSTSTISVSLKDQNDLPLIGHKVVFSIVSGPGIITSQPVQTVRTDGTATATVRSIQSQSDVTTVVKASHLSYPSISTTISILFQGQGTSGGGGSGGGGGGSGGRCRPDWDCTQYTSCTPQGTKTRICRDLENCRTTRDKPSESQSCTYNPTQGTCQSSWSCTAWNDCDNGIQTRTCVDIKNCAADKTETNSCINMCNDNIKNNNEVDVDCGGDCKPCGRYNTSDVAKDLGIPILAVLGVLLIISYFLRKKSEIS
ncbi:hypothetical protein J4455_02550 [Candidatus Woesearchaeota archaeon]|nr:hypothetical protein [Candidatus Woesearchaeota archaeon]